MDGWMDRWMEQQLQYCCLDYYQSSKQAAVFLVNETLYEMWLKDNNYMH